MMNFKTIFVWAYVCARARVGGWKSTY